jgi:hypothetical protein
MYTKIQLENVKGTLGDQGIDGTGTLRRAFNNSIVWGLTSIGWGHELVEGSCEHGNGDKLLEHQTDYQLLKKGSVSWAVITRPAVLNRYKRNSDYFVMSISPQMLRDSVYWNVLALRYFKFLWQQVRRWAESPPWWWWQEAPLKRRSTSTDYTAKYPKNL